MKRKEAETVIDSFFKYLDGLTRHEFDEESLTGHSVIWLKTLDDKPIYKPGETVIITGNMIDDCQYHGLDIGDKHRVLDVYNDFEVIVNNLNARVTVFNKDIKRHL